VSLSSRGLAAQLNRLASHCFHNCVDRVNDDLRLIDHHDMA
jgi:hypothetical protein